MLDQPAKPKAQRDKEALAQLLKFYGDREWRLDHLYYVQDESGTRVLYKRRPAQKAYCENQWVLDIIAKARQLGFCLSPETRILTSDLEWIKLDDMRVGQSIMAVDEQAPKVRGSGRKLRKAIVEKIWEVSGEAIQITTENGAKITATPQHRFLVKQPGYCLPKWQKVEKLRLGDSIRAVTDVWDSAAPEDGWFSGLLDGEGTMRPGAAGDLAVAQRPGMVLDRARNYLQENGYTFREDISRRPIGHHPIHSLVMHRSGEIMRLLGKTRPTRFNREWWIGHKLPGDGNSWCKITGLASLGEQRMIDIQTSERTFIAEGFVSHNSTEIAIEITDFCVFNKDKAAGIIDYKLEDAKKKLAKIKYAYEGLPDFLKARNPLVKSNEDELRWRNGSSCVVGTSHRGGTLQFLHVSEYGKIAAENPEAAREIRKAAFNTIAPGQVIKVESTMHGTSGDFHDMVEAAKAKLAAGTALSPLDFKLHFYGWWLDPKYRVQSSLVTITQEVKEYFADLKARYGISCDADQIAWYQQKLTSLGWDDMREEFPSCLDEGFYNSLEGTFFKKELSKARADKRIGLPVPFDSTRRVHTCWDKGMNEKSDRNSIWWFQHDGVRFRWIDYYENAGETLAHYAGIVEEKRIARKFVYGTHYGPHDLKQRVWASTSPQPKTMQDIAREAGIVFDVVDRVDDKAVSIEAARRAIGMSWFCAEYCARGVECLDNYKKTWSKTISDWTSVPFHNWASNGADALQCGAMGVKPERVPREGRPRGERRGTHWSN